MTQLHYLILALAAAGAPLPAAGWPHAMPAAYARATPACTGPAAFERTVHLMGTLLTIRLERVDRDCAAAAAEAAIVEVVRFEALLSSWTAESEIGRVNAAMPGSVVSLSSDLHALLAEAAMWVDRTGGAFDPAVGALVDAWDLRGAGRVPAPSALRLARARTGWQRADLGAGAIRRGPAGWWLDTGAFGKGAALRAAADVLRMHGIDRATVDFGGQLLVLGGTEVVAVAHPARRTQAHATVRVTDASVATTSSSERFVVADGARLGHVLDPRTGEPVPAWGSVTVVHEDAFAADALSTALFVMGPDAALAWARDRDDVAVLVLRQDDTRVRAGWSAAMEPLLRDAALLEPLNGVAR